MKALLHSLAVAGAIVVCMGQGSPARIDYTLTPVMEAGTLRAIEVDVSFRGDADGETDVHVPGSWGGENELWRGIEGLTLVSGGAMREGGDPGERVLTHRPNAALHLRYRIVQDWEGVPRAEVGNTYRPVIQPTYFHLIGNASLVVPQLDPQTRARVRMRDLPRGWTYASDLEHDGLVLRELYASVIVGGDFRIVEGADRNIRVAIRGEWTFTDAAFIAEVERIISGQRRFWGDRSTPYLVTVIPLTAPNTGWISLGGTGLDDAFAFFATRNSDPRFITRTLAHEGLHTWIPARIGGMPEEGEAAHYWLSEGFTDFYTARLLVRDGVWTPADFAQDLNDMLAAYAQSPVNTEPNTRIAADFWNVADVRRLPYQRGRLLALIWDARLRAAGHDFDDVVFAMRERARDDDPERAAGIFPAAAQSFGVDVSAELAANVEGGALVLLPADVFAPCGTIVTRDVPRFHRGFDIEATTAANNVISGVDPTLPAYAAGLRDGMVLIRRDAGEIGDSEQEIVYVVRDGETERTIRYMPRGHGTYARQSLVLADALEGETLAQCVRVLGGGD